MSNELNAVARFAYEAGQLQRLPRAGWLVAGISNPESVAEHSFRVGILAYVIASIEGANPDRAATLGLFHDIPETRIGDVPSVGKPYVRTPAAQGIARDQVAGLPTSLADHIVALIDEHERAKEPTATHEAQCSRDADKIDCLIAAREYQVQGNQQVQPFVDSMVAAVTTETGKRLAVAAQEVAPGEWWANFAANFAKNSDDARAAR